MSDDLTNDQIALLCALEEHDLSKRTGDKWRDLQQLLSEGYIELVEDNAGSALQLTAKGIAFLGERGAGLNEA